MHESEVATDRLVSVADLVEIAGRLDPSSVVLAGGDRVDDLRLVESARDHGIVDRVVLVGDARKIRRAIDEVGIEIPTEDIVDAEDDEATAAAAVEQVKQGTVDIVLKGRLSTPVINRHMLPLAARPTVSLSSVFDASPIAGGRPLLFTDAGVTTVCNFGRMTGIICNAVEVARVVMGIERPRVAVLSANEKQIPSLASTHMAAALTQRHWDNAIVYGPLSFDLATDPRSVAMKGMPNHPGAREVAGQADILVCPGIDSANAVYKIVAALAQYGDASLADITVGFRLPYAILSRAGLVSTRLDSIALCSVYAQRTLAARRSSATVSVAAKSPMHRVFVINPGSTSIKFAVYEDDRCVRDIETPCTIPPTATRAAREQQVAKLAQHARDALAGDGERIDAIAARGGFLPRPADRLPGGVYTVAEHRDGALVLNDALLNAMLEQPERDHASNFGIPVAAALAREWAIPAYTVDPVIVDEFDDLAQISGYAGITRRSTAHALSVHAAARKAAHRVGRPIEDINVVVAHLGGGITVAVVRGGRITDNSIALLGGGPFTPQRAGALPTAELIDLCYSGRFSRDELIEELTRRGGLASYLGEHRMEAIEARIDAGDETARLVTDAMIYQIAKEIGAMVAAAGCDVEAIVLTGGLVRSERIRSGLRHRVARLAPVLVFEGSLEMGALAAGAADVLSGRTEPCHYTPPQGDSTHE